MRDTYAILGLRGKRAYLAGDIEKAEVALEKQRASLVHLDATLRLFHPDADPAATVSIHRQARYAIFRHCELTRLCREALRDAGKAVPTRLITDQVMRAKNLRLEDRDHRADGRDHLYRALLRMLKAGAVRRLMPEPEAWWELVG